MVYRYSTNYMGPINAEWIEKNGDHWAGGRIDVYGDAETEIYLPVMDVRDWNSFSTWLYNLKTDDLWNLDQITRLYENDNPAIVWFVKEDQ